MSSAHDYLMNLYPKQDIIHAANYSGDLDIIADQIQKAWPAVHRSSETVLTRIYRGVPLRYDDDAGVFELLLAHMEGSNLLQVSLRFAYCCPQSVLVPFCQLNAWLMQRYDMKALSMRPGDMVSDEPFAQREVLDADMFCPVFMPQMQTLWNWWQAGMGGKIARLVPSEIDRLLE